MKTLVEILAAKETVVADLLKRPGVTGVDVGYKYVGGKRTDEIAIRVHVAHKRDNVPEAQRVPAEIDGVQTDVIQRTFVLHAASMAVTDIQIMADTGSYNPVKGGISIGPCRAIGGSVFAGTLGAVVKDNVTGNPMLLSNFHVMCVDNGSNAGDQMAQPSRVDTGSCPASNVGKLHRSALSAAVDGAISTLEGRGYRCEIVDIGVVAGSKTATLGMKVRKRGRTTGLTYGLVDSISLSVNVDYGDGLGVHTLNNQIGIAPDATKNPKFGDHGDSGSVAVDNKRRIVGLYFAGSDDGYGIANPISSVLSELNISLCVGKRKPEHKEIKIEKFETKDGIVDKPVFKEHKNEPKELKVEKIEVKDTTFDKHPKLEKLEIEGPQKRFFENDPKGPVEGDPFDPGRPPVFGPNAPFAADAGNKFTDAAKLTDVKKIEVKEGFKEKNEIKESIKDKIEHKEFGKDKLEFKEQKDHKPEFKEHKDQKPEFKEHKHEAKEHKEHKDQKDHKPEFKEHKPEVKEHKDNKEHKDQKDHKPEFKEHKPEIKELKNEKLETGEGGNKLPDIDPKGPAEGFDPRQPFTPPGGGLIGGQDIEQRLAALEALIGQVAPFIAGSLRPDLSGGALLYEDDADEPDED